MTSEKIEALLNPQIQKSIEQIKGLLRQIENKTIGFQKQTGLHCKKGCGACCLSPHVSTTFVEVLPLAIELWSNGQAEQILAKIERSPKQGQCVFY